MIGLTGGIASGKSTVTARLRELGAFVADADIVSREIMEDKEVLSALRRAFGDGIFNGDGSLNRAACAREVFASPEKTALLNSITHPAIAERLTELTNAAEASGEHPLSFVDAALLIESGFNELCSGVWLITADTGLRIERIMERDGLTYEEAELRIKRQASDEEKARFADVIIENNGGLEELTAKVDEAYAEELARLHPENDLILEEIREAYEEQQD